MSGLGGEHSNHQSDKEIVMEQKLEILEDDA
ncbi:MAG: hypothetical protein QOF02_99, partial [Blastocatellia bacterium]|nr:hypothetical protein [Blastocatellia bacterium]